VLRTVTEVQVPKQYNRPAIKESLRTAQERRGPAAIYPASRPQQNSTRWRHMHIQSATPRRPTNITVPQITAEALQRVAANKEIVTKKFRGGAQK
jgi:hypothetical protein